MRKRNGELWVRHPRPFDGEDALYYIVGSFKKRYKAINFNDGSLELIREHWLESNERSAWPSLRVKSWQAWWEKIA